MYVDLTTISCEVLDAVDLGATLAHNTRSSSVSGDLRGVWYAENGVIGQVIMVRTFEKFDHLLDDHREQFVASSPFGLGDRVRAFTMRAHEAFDFADIMPAGRYGDIYEMRIYELKMGGLAPTLAGWREVLPGRIPHSPMAIGMSALDGRPAITHIYPFADANERMQLRSDLYRDNLWPPTSGPESIDVGTSTIMLPAKGSPWS